MPSSQAPLGRYTGVAIVLHWAIAILIIVNVTLALSSDSLPDEWVRPVIDTHKSIGITVLGLAILRLLWRLAHRPPEIPSAYARWERGLSHVVHWALYLMIFLMPLSGWIHDSAWKDAATHPMQLFGLFEWPRVGWVMHLSPATRENMHDLFGQMHFLGADALYVLVALHVVGALKHQFFDRAREFQLMWF